MLPAANSICLALGFLVLGGAWAAEPPARLLQQGLFEEEANQHLPAAIHDYQQVVHSVEPQRKLEATALFRLGECYRKLGETNHAVAHYERVLRDFSDQTSLAQASRQQLAVLGVTSSPSATNNVADEETAQIDRLQDLVRNSPDLVNAIGQNGETLLDAAAAKGQLRVAQFLLDHGADVNGRGGGRVWAGLTALHFAAGNGRNTMVKFLLQHGARVDARSGDGVTPLLLAVAKGYRIVSETLIAAGAPLAAPTTQRGFVPKVNFPDLQFLLRRGEGPLVTAVRGGFTSLVQLLLQSSKPGNQVPAVEKQQALLVAAQNHQVDMAAALVTAGADVNTAGPLETHGTSYPLLVATESRHADMVEWLLNHGAKPNVRGYVQRSRSRELATYKFTVTPLTIALDNDDLPIAQALLAHHADPNLLDGSKVAPLIRAVASGSVAMAELLARHGAHLNQVSSGLKALRQSGGAHIDEATPLTMAVRLSNQAMAEALMRAGADPNVPDLEKETPLHWAASGVAKPMVELLLAHQAKVDPVNAKGWTPLEFLQECVRKEYYPAAKEPDKAKAIITLLEQHGADP